ncbi:hypothetical protein Tco_0989747 [Tanacetum coccineum]|uniref:Uncharacterized protein n=1 Tax=Tanacetum coccineum TaxID=301880 RepID=A0ABQ5EV90_9ASTR
MVGKTNTPSKKDNILFNTIASLGTLLRIDNVGGDDIVITGWYMILQMNAWIEILIRNRPQNADWTVSKSGQNVFNLDPNVRFNLSFNLPAIERDITNDDDVEFFIDCATNSITSEIPHLYIRPPKVEARIIPGPVGILQKYVRKVNEDVSEDDHFMQGPWLQAIVYLHGEGLTISSCLGDMKKTLHQRET